MPAPAIKTSDVTTVEKWQQILADLLTDPKELLQILGLEPADAGLDPRVLKSFPLKVPRPFLQRIEKGNWQDPLLLQILPVNQELDSHPRESQDPLGEAGVNLLPGLLHKYHGRVLLTVAPHCAIHCRYCFRRHFDYGANTPGRNKWARVVEYIAADTTITEVIFSGGDPLAVSDKQLGWLIRELETIPHLQRLRIHTRTPVMIPQRVTAGFLETISGSRFKSVIVLHCNHGNEIDHQVALAIARLGANNITLLNQSVLLAGVNDNVEALTSLSEKLFSINVLPYYLHLLDPVEGTGHFNVPETKARQLISAMQAKLPGYLVPHLVREEAGADAKIRMG